MVAVPNRRYLGRYREILSVLTRHGFGWLVAEMNLRHLLPFGQRLGRAAKGAVEPSSQAVQLRLAVVTFGERVSMFEGIGVLLAVAGIAAVAWESRGTKEAESVHPATRAGRVGFLGNSDHHRSCRENLNACGDLAYVRGVATHGRGAK